MALLLLALLLEERHGHRARCGDGALERARVPVLVDGIVDAVLLILVRVARVACHGCCGCGCGCCCCCVCAAAAAGGGTARIPDRAADAAGAATTSKGLAGSTLFRSRPARRHPFIAQRLGDEVGGEHAPLRQMDLLGTDHLNDAGRGELDLEGILPHGLLGTLP